MAHPSPPGLTPSEVSFICEMEMVTVVPRGRLNRQNPLPQASPEGPTSPSGSPSSSKKQRRANIVPPAWLHPLSLTEIIRLETVADPQAFSKPPPPPARADALGFAHRVNTSPLGGADVVLAPPFLPSCIAESPAGYLPYHWFELAEMLLTHAGDDMPASAGEVRGLLRDLVEVRAAKMRSSTTQLESFGGGVINLRGVGAMELAENRGFVLGVVDGVRKLGASAEATRREEDEVDGGGDEDEESDEDMGI